MRQTILLVLALFTLSVFSQTTKEDSLKAAYEQSKKSYKEYQKESKKGEDFNLFSKRGKDTKVSFYCSFDLGYQQLSDSIGFKDNQSLTVGLSVAAVFNKHLAIGVWGCTNTENLLRTMDSTQLYMRYGSGGIFLQLRLLPSIPVHLTIPVKAGFGTISYWENDWGYYNQSYLPDNMGDSYFIFEPGLNAEFNIVKYFKISAGLSYKWTDAIDLYNTPNYILNGWNANLSLIILY